MNKLLRNFSIHRKLLSVLLISSVASLFLGGIFLMLLEISNFQQSTRNDLQALASMVGDRSSAALMFEDSQLAGENLAIFSNYPEVEQACLYDVRGWVFARFSKQTEHPSNLGCPVSMENATTHFEKNELWVSQNIVLDNVGIGKVFIRADLTEAYLSKVKFTVVLLMVLGLTALMTFLLTAPLLRMVSLPISNLLRVVDSITQSQDYSLRAIKVNDDELGELVNAFNGLIERVDTQNRELLMAKNHFLALYDDNPTMIFNLNTDFMLVSVNRTGAAQLQLDASKLSSLNIFDLVYEDDKPLMQQMLTNCLLNPSKVYKQELRILCVNGAKIWVRATARLVENAAQMDSLLLVCEDATETHLLNEQIAYQASHDSLTGLANRMQFDARIRQLLEHAKVNNTEHALCYLDLDQFKVINDTCGHLAGDELLRQLGELLRKNIRKDDFIARLGGDEFGVLMRNCSLAEAAQISNNLRDIISDFHFAWEDRSFNVGVSIGITNINTASGNAVNILKEADAACYIAKDKGRNRVQVFRPDDQELALRQGEMQWVEKIQLGLENNYFCLYGQLIVPLNDIAEGLHFETLVRYREVDGSIIPPGAFLPAAERYNLISNLDRWVIRNLFAWLAEHAEVLANLQVCSVNLSGLSLSDENMLSYISEQFSFWNIPTHKICFEITETAAISNLSFATQFIRQLRAQGCLFSLDDFGSGLSSFGYLKNLPVDFLKIDGLFVKDIIDDQVDLAMVKSINEVGHVLHKKTIAEFVENEQIFNLLRSMGVDYAQGYGVGKPLPLNALIASAGLVLAQPASN